jgi:hypothetical protein
MKKTKKATASPLHPRGEAVESTTVYFPGHWWQLGLDKLQEEILLEDDRRVSASMQLSLLVRYVHDHERFREGGHDSFEDWCESIDRTKQWGHQLVKAAEHVWRVDNARQARALAGLTGEEADAVVDAAQASGSVTSRSLAEARARTVGANRRAAQGIEEAAVARKIVKAARKLLELLGQHSGTPGEQVTWAEFILEYWEGDVETERRAAA